MDVDVVYVVNFVIVKNLKKVFELIYWEMCEFLYVGFFVFYDEVLILVFYVGILVYIKNMNNFDFCGMCVVYECENNNGLVVGIVSDDGFCSIYISKYLMN